MTLDDLSGSTKVEREKWWQGFWNYLDQHPETGDIVRRWQAAGCDPIKLALAIQRYVTNPPDLRDRKLREKWFKRTLTGALPKLRDVETVYRYYKQTPSADRIAQETVEILNLLSRRKLAFNTKRLGISRSWTDLAMIEGFVFEATRARPAAREIVCLIRAGRYAAQQQQPDPWEANPENIRKGLAKFKKANPHECYLWTNPSNLSNYLSVS